MTASENNRKGNWQKKAVLLTCLLTLLPFTIGAQVTPCQWAKSGAWRNGFTKANPHKTLNVKEFYEQYHKNPNQYYALFRWLSETDLQTIPKGKHPIPRSTLVASVEDSENQPLEKRNTESHRRKADFMVVVSGTEGFALLDHASSTVSVPYDDKKDVMRYSYEPQKTHFFDVTPGHFVIFFPDDWHIAKVATKKKNQAIRVIVVKMDYID